MSAVRKALTLGAAVAAVGAVALVALVVRGFSARESPSALEKGAARLVRNVAIPRAAHRASSPLQRTPEVLAHGRDLFHAKCADCHGALGDGNGATGRQLYPRASDLRSAATQALSDGDLHYIIAEGVQHTGMPALDPPNGALDADAWALVQYVRSLAPLPAPDAARALATAATATYTGSRACARCHADLYQRWERTPMANVVRDPREHPDAIIPNLATNRVAPFTLAQVALVYGSIWKQRYFTRIGNDYYPLGAQWDIGNRTWRPYHVGKSADWWTAHYPDDNLHRPTGPTCDGCHSVNYDTRTHAVTEWNVGCERCHGPGSAHVAQPLRTNIINPAHLDAVGANDACIQCHSQGRPREVPTQGGYYDWPVGYRVGLRLQDFWRLEAAHLGETSFLHFADGTAHKNRMQGNDFVQSRMYARGVTCFSCHDSHGTGTYAQLRAPVEKLCLGCHAPMSANGPSAPTIEAHTQHRADSPGSQCVNCHMPKIATQGVPGAFVRSHTFRFITPAMTDKYQMPNPCTSCHTDKTTAWATDALRRWPTTSPWRM